MKRVLKSAVGIGVSAFLIWWVLRGQDLGDVFAQISQANPWYLVASIAVGTAGYLIRAWRWKVLLHPVKPDTALRSRFASITIGFAVTNLTALRMGEIARAFALTRVERITLSGSVGSLVVERFLDAIVLGTLFLVPMALPSFPGAEGLLSGVVRGLLGTTFVLLAIGVVGLVTLVFFPELVARLAERLFLRVPGGWAPRLVEGLKSFLSALRVLRDTTLLIKAMAWSSALWLWTGFSFWLAFKAFGIDLGFAAAVFTQSAVGFAVALPAGPAFVGTFQLGVDLAVSGVYGVPEPTMLAFAFGYHFAGFIPVTMIGLYYAWRIGFSVGDIRKQDGTGLVAESEESDRG